MNLSKSLYTKGLQCPRALWLKKYNNEVLTKPDNLVNMRFETGNEIGELACELFPNGTKIEYSADYAEMIESTKKCISNGTKYIYEATFSFNGVLIMIDALEIDTNNTVSIYEVKSSTSIKDIYLHDISIQYYVLQQLGYSINSANIVHINSSYVRGEILDIEELFSINDVTNNVIELQKNIPNTLEKFKQMLSDKENEPKIEIGKHCHDPYQCDAKEYCWNIQEKIPEYSIFNVFNLGSKKQKALSKKGIKDIMEIPKNFVMTPKQALDVNVHKTQETYINKIKIKEFVNTLSYPIYHLDFETFQQAIPKYTEVSPYEQIPFQYSLHIEHEGGTLEHKEYLSSDSIDPRFELTKSLCADIPEDVTVLVYNMSFEKSVIKKLASPYNARTAHLMKIHNNIKDLMVPFQKKYYVSPDQKGSYSIKNVLPALVPTMVSEYQKIDGVQNGSDAMNVFKTLGNMEHEKKQKMRNSLLSYCKLDTLAMVKILEVLKKV